MKRQRSPLPALACVLAASAALLVWQSTQLPETVATHFNAAGKADGWMSRDRHLISSLAFGLLFPFLPTVIFALALRLPVKWVNLPHKHHWLAPERANETCRWLIRHGLWLTCLLMCLTTAVQALILQANLQSPQRLSPSLSLLALGGFLAGMATWLLVFWRRFSTRE
jgi:hypothetical protein